MGSLLRKTRTLIADTACDMHLDSCCPVSVEEAMAMFRAQRTATQPSGRMALPDADPELGRDKRSDQVPVFR